VSGAAGTASRPLVVGIGGTTRESSSSAAALAISLEGARRAGAEVLAVDGRKLAALGSYDPDQPVPLEGPRAEYVDLIRRADAVVIASPGYHGSVSGLVKNALDMLEDLRDDERPYLSGRAVGCIGTAYGWQAAVGTLAALRSIGHALRGWPTSLGVALNAAETHFAGDGTTDDPHALAQLELMGRQVVELANALTSLPAGGGTQV
jgi:FMN reductase